MLIIKALNITENAEDAHGKADYDVLIHVNSRPIWSGRVKGHIRKNGAAELLRCIANEMDRSAKLEEDELEKLEIG